MGKGYTKEFRVQALNMVVDGAYTPGFSESNKGFLVGVNDLPGSESQHERILRLGQS